MLGNDIKEFALETFRRNHNKKKKAPIVIRGDIRTIEEGDIITRLSEHGIDELDCLIGGPPCQGFSQMNRSNSREESKITKYGGYSRLNEDPRNDLVLRFLEIAAVINPKVVVIENVPQFLSHYHDGKPGGIAQQVEEILIQLGYEVTCKVLNAANFGVPQLRQRAVIIGSRVRKIEMPAQTHYDPELKKSERSKVWVTVEDAISDLPQDPPLEETLGGGINIYQKEVNCAYRRKMRTSRGFPFNHLTRNYKPSVIEIIKHMQPGETWDAASARLRIQYEHLIERMVSSGLNRDQAKARLEADGEILPVFYKDYYRSAYTRLEWSRPALTITANSNFLGSGRFTHPIADRGITMREAARLQSFDDAFTFYTSNDEQKITANMGVGLDMIGEAVPPLLAEAIAKTIIRKLDETEK